MNTPEIEYLEKGATIELTRDLAAVAKKHGIEFVLCITHGEPPKLKDGREAGIIFIDGKDEDSENVHVATSMVAGGLALYRTGLAVARYEGRRLRAEREAAEKVPGYDANGSPVETP